MSTVKLSFGPRALGVALLSCTAALPALATESSSAPSAPSKQSNIGGVTGLALGAAAAGPVGAIVGLTAGVLIGDRYHREQLAAAQTTQELKDTESARTQLEHSVATLDASLAQQRAAQARLDATLQKSAAVELDVSFRTDDDGIPEQSLTALMKLGALAASLPEVTVRIAGYADPRGAASYNEALSLRRAQGVAALLTSAGVPAGRLLIEAHGAGESQSVPGDLDGYAFDRRVSVRLEPGAAGQVARND